MFVQRTSETPAFLSIYRERFSDKHRCFQWHICTWWSSTAGVYFRGFWSASPLTLQSSLSLPARPQQITQDTPQMNEIHRSVTQTSTAACVYWQISALSVCWRSARGSAETSASVLWFYSQSGAREENVIAQRLLSHCSGDFIEGFLLQLLKYVTLDHKTSHKGPFFIFILLGQDNIWLRYNYLKIWNLRVQKNLNIEKITFKVVQMKFLAMHITNQKLSCDIFTVGNLQNIFMEHDLYLIS